MTGLTDAPEGTQDGTLEHFAASIAHDFNNLLTGILGNLELLQNRAVRNNITGLDSYLDGANSASARAVALAARLMAFSGHGTCPPEFMPVDALLARFSPRAACSLNAGEAGLYGDPAQFELAMTELLANAEAAGGKIFISTALAGERIIITLRDTGPGMPPGILARAAEPFFTTHANSTGRGFGLPIVARVMRGWGGGMRIEAEEKAGCTVTLTLPRA